VNDEWPGNFRQLVGCLRAMLALCEPGDTLMIEALPADVRFGVTITGKSQSPRETGLSTLEAVKATAMQDALRAAKVNVSLAARQLGVSRSTLYRRMQS
jgi:sigma-54 dependent transcriptional regulator, acetoin dehydrogenase operon transcriptional activator AcoR